MIRQWLTGQSLLFAQINKRLRTINLYFVRVADNNLKVWRSKALEPCTIILFVSHVTRIDPCIVLNHQPLLFLSSICPSEFRCLNKHAYTFNSKIISFETQSTYIYKFNLLSLNLYEYFCILSGSRYNLSIGSYSVYYLLLNMFYFYMRICFVSKSFVLPYAHLNSRGASNDLMSL